MKKILILSITLIILLVSCKKNEEPNINNQLSLFGTWNENYIERYDVDGELTGMESIDTIRLIKLSIGDFVIQEMMIDTVHSFYFLLYSTYEFESNVLKRYPDSLIDIDMNKYYWNSSDSTFGTFPILASPREYIIVETSETEFVENRIIEGYGSLVVKYNRLLDTNTDLLVEFENFSKTLKNTEYLYKAYRQNIYLSNQNMEVTPVYNEKYSEFCR